MGLISRVSSRTYTRKTLTMLRRALVRLHVKQSSDVIGVLPSSHVERRIGSTNPGENEEGRKFGVVGGKFIAKPGNAVAKPDKITHTGQYYDEEDWRNVRFNARHAKKLVNRNWAADLTAEIEPIAVSGDSVMCDGSRDPVTGHPIPGEQGHPRVWVNIEKGKTGTCIYWCLRNYNKDYHPTGTPVAKHEEFTTTNHVLHFSTF